ncbi:MAG: sulfurtransferase TusA family protein [Planctomycetes bacterium]|nr:sulfurtransferase TusA family protein [Planctomycetota bacterium]
MLGQTKMVEDRANQVSSNAPQERDFASSDLENRKLLDVRAFTCPITSLRTKIALESMEVGEVLIVRLKGEAPLKNVPKFLADEGHEIVSTTGDASGAEIVVKRGS